MYMFVKTTSLISICSQFRVATAIIRQICESVYDQNLNNDDCIEAKINEFSPVIQNTIIKIYNKECYQKKKLKRNKQFITQIDRQNEHYFLFL